jgi:hypothetical protein
MERNINDNKIRYFNYFLFNKFLNKMRDRSRENSREKRILTTGGTGKLHVSNLSFNIQEQEIKEEFEKYSNLFF